MGASTHKLALRTLHLPASHAIYSSSHAPLVASTLPSPRGMALTEPLSVKPECVTSPDRVLRMLAA